MSMGTINDDAGFAELTAEFWENQKKMEEYENVPESPAILAEEKDEPNLQAKEESSVMPVKEKDESDLLIKEKSQVLTREHQQKERKVESYCIRTNLYEDVFLKFKMLCGRMNVTMGIVTARMIDDFVEKNTEELRIIMNENTKI